MAKDFNQLLADKLIAMFSRSFEIQYSGVTEIDGNSDEYIEQIKVLLGEPTVEDQYGTIVFWKL